MNYPKQKAILSPLLIIAIFGIILALPVYLRGDQASAPAESRYREGQEVPPGDLKHSDSLSAGQKLVLDDTYHLFFSNVPEMPTEPGILCRVDDVMPPSGLVRVLFSHMNLLIDWAQQPLGNLPASAGFAVENRTERKLDVYAVRWGMGVNRTPDGEYLFLEDAAPVRPGGSETQYFGSAVGNYVVQQWFQTEDRDPVLLGSMPPGGRVVVSGDVGPRGWIVGMYDLKFVDPSTGRQVGKEDLAGGESVGVKTFIAPMGHDINSFLDQPSMQEGVMPLRKGDRLHMRGLFVPGSYPDNPLGEAVSKHFTVNYSAAGGKVVSFALAAGDKDQGEDPETPNYVPDVFVNDCLRNGIDPHNEGGKGINGGNYGVDYTVNLNLTGPAALVVQGADHPEDRSLDDFIDLNNQILTVALDGKVSTVRIRDPNYDKFYTDLSLLRPPGYGRVIGVFREQGGHHHLLRFTLPPNGYGPVRFYLLPLY